MKKHWRQHTAWTLASVLAVSSGSPAFAKLPEKSEKTGMIATQSEATHDTEQDGNNSADLFEEFDIFEGEETRQGDAQEENTYEEAFEDSTDVGGLMFEAKAPKGVVPDGTVLLVEEEETDARVTEALEAETASASDARKEGAVATVSRYRIALIGADGEELSDGEIHSSRGKVRITVSGFASEEAAADEVTDEMQEDILNVLPEISVYKVLDTETGTGLETQEESGTEDVLENAMPATQSTAHRLSESGKDGQKHPAGGEQIRKIAVKDTEDGISFTLPGAAGSYLVRSESAEAAVEELTVPQYSLTVIDSGFKGQNPQWTVEYMDERTGEYTPVTWASATLRYQQHKREPEKMVVYALGETDDREADLPPYRITATVGGQRKIFLVSVTSHFYDQEELSTEVPFYIRTTVTQQHLINVNEYVQVHEKGVVKLPELPPLLGSVDTDVNYEIEEWLNAVPDITLEGRKEEFIVREPELDKTQLPTIDLTTPQNQQYQDEFKHTHYRYNDSKTTRLAATYTVVWQYVRLTDPIQWHVDGYVKAVEENELHVVVTIPKEEANTERDLVYETWIESGSTDVNDHSYDGGAIKTAIDRLLHDYGVQGYDLLSLTDENNVDVTAANGVYADGYTDTPLPDDPDEYKGLHLTARFDDDRNGDGTPDQEQLATLTFRSEYGLNGDAAIKKVDRELLPGDVIVPPEPLDTDSDGVVFTQWDPDISEGQRVPASTGPQSFSYMAQYAPDVNNDGKDDQKQKIRTITFFSGTDGTFADGGTVATASVAAGEEGFPQAPSIRVTAQDMVQTGWDPFYPEGETVPADADDMSFTAVYAKSSKPSTPSEPSDSSDRDSYDSGGVDGRWVHVSPEDPFREITESEVPLSKDPISAPEWHRWKFILNNGTMIFNKKVHIRNPYALQGQPSEGWFTFNDQGIMQYGWYRDVAGKWYYMHVESDGMLGTLLDGWHYDERDSKWYYLKPGTGEMQLGWQEIGKKWYYFNPSAPAPTYTYDAASGLWKFNGSESRPYGSMYQGETTPDGYQVGEDGAWIE